MTALIVSLFFVIVLAMIVFMFCHLLEKCEDSIWALLFLIIVGGLWICSAIEVSVPTEKVVKTEDNSENLHLNHTYLKFTDSGVWILADTLKQPEYKMIIDTVYRKIK